MVRKNFRREAMIKFDIKEILPDEKRALQNQGMTPKTWISPQIHSLYISASELFTDHAKPVGITKKVSATDFGIIFEGEGNNISEAPLYDILPRVDHLILFALTMGEAVSKKIDTLFEEHDFAVGTMLDSIASIAADKATAILEKSQYFQLSKESLIENKSVVVSYSPGYCGWHISGQKKLFQYLQPEKIGIELNSSFLMSPLKSVTGVLAAGQRDIHIFKPDFSFCEICRTYSCLTRMKEFRNTNFH